MTTRHNFDLNIPYSHNFDLNSPFSFEDDTQNSDSNIPTGTIDTEATTKDALINTSQSDFSHKNGRETEKSESGFENKGMLYLKILYK